MTYSIRRPLSNPAHPSKYYLSSRQNVRRYLLLLAFSLLVQAAFSQNVFVSSPSSEVDPQVTLEYSNLWEAAVTSNLLSLSIPKSDLDPLGLKIEVSAKIDAPNDSGFSMERTALKLFTNDQNSIKKVNIDGYSGFRTTIFNEYKGSERIIESTFIDFPQYSMLQINIVGSLALYKKNKAAIDGIFSSLSIREGRRPQPQHELSVEAYQESQAGSYQQFIADSILTHLYSKVAVKLGDVNLKSLHDFFKWKRSGPDSMSLFEDNNLLLHIDWLSFSHFDITIEKRSLTLNLYDETDQLLTMETQLEDPIALGDYERTKLETFYLDYRKKWVIMDNKVVMKEGKTLELPYLLVNGKTFPLNHGKLYWH